MRLLDQDPIDPEIAATLDAIDATLAGDPVDARYAEVAEIALLLSADRPPAPPEFARSMDDMVERRFASRPEPEGQRKLRRPLVWQSMGALAAGVALIVAIVVVAGGGGSGSSSTSSSYSSIAASAGTSSTAGSGASSAAVPPSQAAAAPSASSSPAAPTVTPPTSGRKVVQSAQLSLDAAPSRIDDVAQEIYNVVGQVNGVVNSSTVTQGGPGGYASFQLSVPSTSLPQTMSRLSQLNYAQVVSSTNNTQDITDQYNATTRALADARALRTSLLKQLANASTTEQVDSINAQIHDAEASISSDEATLAKLNRQVNLSQLQVTINAHTPPTPISHGGGFGIGRAAHDSGRVLTVVAGGALIALAALTPIALLVALAWWVGAAARRRRRDQALDLV